MAGVYMTSFSGLTVHDCWVMGFERFPVGPAGEEEEFFQIRTEWSDKSITSLRRRYHDLVKLANSFETQSLTLNALQKIREAEENNDIESKLDEVEKLLRNIIKTPPKYSQSEAVLTFFKTSPLDYTLKTMFDPIQPFYQSPVTIADVRRANGFCLANTETVLFDAYLLEKAERSPVNSSQCSSEIEAQIWRGTKYPNGIRHDNKFVHTDHSANPVLPTGAIINKEADYHPKKTTPVTPTNQTYLHLHASETDILE